MCDQDRPGPGGPAASAEAVRVECDACGRRFFVPSFALLFANFEALCAACDPAFMAFSLKVKAAEEAKPCV